MTPFSRLRNAWEHRRCRDRHGGNGPWIEHRGCSVERRKLARFAEAKADRGRCDPDSEITFDYRTIGYGNDSHGDTCCLCGTLLPAVKRDPDWPEYIQYRGLAQGAVHFRRECSHMGGVWGGQLCSEACRVSIREWLRTERSWDVCPYQHRAKGVHGHGVPASVFFDLMEELAARERCPECDGSGELFEDSMTALGVPGGWVATGPCPACNGTKMATDPEQWAGGVFSTKTLRAAAALDDPEFPMPPPEYFDA